MQHASSALRRFAIATQILAFVYSCLSLLRPASLLVITFNDDAAYYLNIARHYAGGHGWTFDRINPTNGFQPLWEYILVGICRLLPGAPDSQIRWIGLLESALLSISGFILWRLVDRHFGPRAGASLAVLYVALYFFPTRSGMETSLLTFLVALLLAVVAARNPWNSGSYLPAAGFGLLLGALMLTRLDSVFLVGSTMIVLLVEVLRGAEGSRTGQALRCGLTGLVAACVVAPYLAHNLSTFGHLMPISGAVKSSFPVPGWHYPAFGLTVQQRLFFFASNVLALGLIVWRFGPGRTTDSRFWRAGLTALSLGVVIHHAYSALFMRWGVMGWHFALGRILTIILAAILMERALQRLSPRAATRAWAVAGLTILLAGGFAVYRRDWGMISKTSWRQITYDTAVWVRDHLPADAILAMKDSGHMGLFSGRRVVNLDGIVNSFEYQERMRRGEFASYVEDTGIEYIVYAPPESPYGSFRAHSWSNLYDADGGSVELLEKDEVYRSTEFQTPQGRMALVVCRTPR